MITFASPGFLWLLLVVPVLVYVMRFNRSRRPAVGYSALEPLRALADRKAAAWLWARDALRVATVAFLVLALARPQEGLKSDLQDIKATDMLLCLDVSDSMRAEDFTPKNRITVAKESAISFIERRRHDRIGLVVFAEAALTQCPLTVDHGALAGLLQGIEIGDIPPRRTAIGDGLAICVERLKATAARSKVIVLLTDGVNNAGTIDPVTAAQAAVSFGIKIYTIGAASPEGGYMTVQDPVFGTQRVKVADSLDEVTLTRIAEETGGKYFRATNARGLRQIFGEIDQMEKTDIKVRKFTEYLERFEWLLLPALLLAGLELALGQIVLRGIP